MSLDAEAIKYIQGLALQAADKSVVEVGDDKFLVSADGVRRFTKDDVPETIHLHTLTGLVELIKRDGLGAEVKFVEVASPDDVRTYGALDQYGNRPLLAEVTPFTKTMDFGRYYDQENFQIGMRSTFVNNDHRNIVIEFSGKLEEQGAATYSDDGISQTAVVKNGVASKANAKVPSPVILKPYRTFIEVDQPASEFILRIRKGAELALFEADGNAWKNEAIHSVADYLEEALNSLEDEVLIVG